jgi:hypothetical protein
METKKYTVTESSKGGEKRALIRFTDGSLIEVWGNFLVAEVFFVGTDSAVQRRETFNEYQEAFQYAINSANNR